MDYFAIFEEKRRPWLDADALKEKFHRLTASHHPDVADRSETANKSRNPAAAANGDLRENGTRDFSEINHAYQTLSDLPARLRHLLALEFPEINTRQLPISDELSELFLAISENQQALAAFFAKQSQAASPLARALLAQEQFALLETTQRLCVRVAKCEEETEQAVRDLAARWGKQEPGEPEKQAREREAQGAELAALYQSSAFLKKWSAQLREATARLHA